MAETLEYLNERELGELSRLDARIKEVRARRRVLMNRAYARAARDRAKRAEASAGVRKILEHLTEGAP